MNFKKKIVLHKYVFRLDTTFVSDNTSCNISTTFDFLDVVLRVLSTYRLQLP